MANQALNNNQLEAMLMPKIRIAVDYVVQKIWNENREVVRQVVYEAYTPKQYERTGEFKEAWDTDTSVSGNKAHGEFRYSPESLTIGSNGQHSSIFDGASSRDYLAEMKKMKDKIPGIEGIIPYRSDSERPLYEYLLSLSLKLKRQDFAQNSSKSLPPA